MKLIKLVLVFCASNAFALSAVKRLDEDNVTQAYATFRRAQIKSVDYDIDLHFKKGSEEFQGETLIRAELNTLKFPLVVDLVAKSVGEIQINGSVVSDVAQKKGALEIPAKYLKDKNEIRIQYIGTFVNSGEGLTHFTDPEDKAEYIYSNLEPYGAHLFFPCFDQPNFRAVFNIKLRGPKSWKFISNANLKATSKAETADEVISTFESTHAISTYLVFVGAGEYTQWTADAAGIPMSLYARKSLAKYIDAKNIFDITRRGLKFYGAYFDYKYPFPKYDQIFAPDLAPGAMENPGAVTLNERMVHKAAVTKSDIDSRSNTILHEMAHMWFGDLVTMSWWNDLWLNESFATYMSYVAQSSEFKLDSVWTDFFREKMWGYWQDSLVTTHPIEAKVLDVQTGMGNFDGITYAKGGAALKQLHFFVGDKGFREGVAAYFKKYAWQNTVRENFTDSIAAASGKDLSKWSKAWLQTAGLNEVSVDWKCQDGKISKFDIRQKPSSSNTLSPHRTRIGFYLRKPAGNLELNESIDVDYSEKLTPVKDAVGKSCPDLVYANQDDHDYGTFILDPVSLAVVSKELSHLPTTLLRSMTWDALDIMVREAKLSAVDYMKALIEQLPQESSEVVSAGIEFERRVYTKYLSVAERATIAPALEAMLWKRIQDLKPKSSEQVAYYDKYVKVVQSPEGVKTVADLLSGKQKIRGIDIDQERRWDLIFALSANGSRDAVTLINRESAVDKSQTGKVNEYASLVAIPTAESKQFYWNEFQNNRSIGFDTLRKATRSFYNDNRPELSELFVEPYFKNVKSRDWSKDYALVRPLVATLFPAVYTRAALRRSEREFQNTKAKLPYSVQRAWLEANDELARALKVRGI